MTSATIDTRNLERRFASLRTNEIPSAVRNTVNDLAFDMRGRMIQEMQRIFDKPTAAVLKVPWVDRATKGGAGAKLYLSDYIGTKGGAGPSHAITPHMTGQPNTRGRKGLEKRLQSMGRITANEWLVPASGAPLDSFGNFKGSEVMRMIADIGAGNQFAGDSANTGTKNKAKRGKAGVYIWLRAAHGLQYGRPKGIYRRVGRKIMPVMVVVRSAPTYAKRYRWQEIVQSYTKRRIQYHAQRAIDQAIRRRQAS
jgi:hypothetical protein